MAPRSGAGSGPALTRLANRVGRGGGGRNVELDLVLLQLRGLYITDENPSRLGLLSLPWEDLPGSLLVRDIVPKIPGGAWVPRGHKVREVTRHAIVVTRKVGGLGAGASGRRESGTKVRTG